MHRYKLIGAATAVLLMLAGCTGSFDIDQTEPIRVQIDGDGDRSSLSGDDQREYHVTVEEQEEVEVTVEVRRTSDDPSRVIIEVQDEDGNVLATRVVTVEGEASGGTSTDGNATDGNGTDGGDTTQQLVIETLNIDVRGKDNIVIVTQNVEGDAEVQVSAREAKGQGDASGDTEMDDTDAENSTLDGLTA